MARARFAFEGAKIQIFLIWNAVYAGGSNEVRLEYNNCGCVYGLQMTAAWDIISMEPTVCGIPDTTDPLNTCSVNG